MGGAKAATLLSARLRQHLVLPVFNAVPAKTYAEFRRIRPRAPMFQFAEPKNAIEGIADADFFGLTTRSSTMQRLLAQWAIAVSTIAKAVLLCRPSTDKAPWTPKGNQINSGRIGFEDNLELCRSGDNGSCSHSGGRFDAGRSSRNDAGGRRS
jgi:hypothetical protein